MGNAEWKPLYDHQEQIKSKHIKNLLKEEERNQKFVARFEDIVFDYTHEKITLETVEKYFKGVVEQYNLFDKIQGLFNGVLL